MSACARCSADVPPTSRFCGACGAPVAEFPHSGAATVAIPQRSTEPSSGSIDEGRFPAGTLLAGRYRIISLLGRGGMGEVYRANDIKLQQAAALKFLPHQQTSSERALAA
jgi:serine/threonine-protein kinase